jgi:hypothetical protein
MAFARFDPAQHKLKADDYEFVEQDHVSYKIHPLNQSLPLFMSEGLNPCIGIIIRGTIDIENDPQAFTIFYHYSGPGNQINHNESKENEITQKIVEHCSEALSTMLTQLNDFLGDEEGEVVLKESLLIRCQQVGQNIQEQVAEELKKILASSAMIKEIITDSECLDENIDIQFENYKFTSLEPLEEYKGNHHDSIHVFIHSDKSTGLCVIYYKGYEYLEDILAQAKPDSNLPHPG